MVFELKKRFIEYNMPLAEISKKSAREKNNRNAIAELLERTGNLNNNTFWQAAQAISGVLLEGYKEKHMVQGFLYGKESYGKAEAKVDKYQRTLFEEEKDER